jgi:hypothetical protein
MAIKPRLQLENLIVEDIASERMAAVSDEIRGIFSMLEVAGILGVGVDVRVDLVVTGRMSEHVERIGAYYGNPGRSYSQTRRGLKAVAITLYGGETRPLPASVVFDAAVWNANAGQSVGIRCHTLLHEIRHIVQHVSRPEAQQRMWRSSSTTFAEELNRGAFMLWDEFDADWFAGTIAREIVKDGNGESVDVARLLLTWMEEAVLATLTRLREFSTEQVQGYRLRNRGLDGLWEEGGTLLFDLLTILAHLTSHAVVTNCVSEITQRLMALPAFRAYLADDWQKFVEALAVPSVDDAVPELARIVAAVLRRVGLVIEDLPGGQLYIQVVEPILADVQ